MREHLKRKPNHFWDGVEPIEPGHLAVFNNRGYVVKEVTGDRVTIYARRQVYIITKTDLIGRNPEDVANLYGGRLVGAPFQRISSDYGEYTTQNMEFPRSRRRVPLQLLNSL